jgi:NAD(P)-dependent dehydrogenase (short-subunit alcohol dehydrogenase family)
VQKALPLLPDGASIVLNSSIVGSKGLPSNSVYSATKAAIRSFARTWTTDLKDRHIRMEMAAVTTDARFRGQIFKTIGNRADDLLRDGRSLEEFRRAVFIRSDRVPVDWASRVIGLITEMYKMSESEQQAVSWQKLASRIRQEYVESKAS